MIESKDILFQEKRLQEELNIWTHYNAPTIWFTKTQIKIHNKDTFSRSGNTKTLGHVIYYEFSFQDSTIPDKVNNYVWGHDALFPTVDVLEIFTTAAREAMLKVLTHDCGVAV